MRIQSIRTNNYQNQAIYRKNNVTNPTFGMKVDDTVRILEDIVNKIAKEELDLPCSLKMDQVLDAIQKLKISGNPNSVDLTFIGQHKGTKTTAELIDMLFNKFCISKSTK